MMGKMHNTSWSFPNRKFRKLKRAINMDSEISISIGGEQSYGDSNFIIFGKSNRVLDDYIYFDTKTNVLEVSASISVKDTLNYLLEFGRTLSVVPGTMNATIGGCIASDIHGKNSLWVGSFSNSVCEILLSNPSGVFWINRINNLEWKSTVGGQGLSGVIMRAKVTTASLKSTDLVSQKILTKGIYANLIELIKISKDHEFAVSWIDSHGTGLDNFGYVEVADTLSTASKLNKIRNFDLIPKFFPRIKMINPISIYIFSLLTRSSASRTASKKVIISRWDFLFPNINLGKWNRLFGRSGFHEIQFLCDLESLEVASDLILKVCKSRNVFLIGVKVLDNEPEGFLSFPGRGLSIAVNFAADKSSSEFVQEIYSEIIEKLNSRVYLTKDWVLTADQFRLMYPKYKLLQEFRSISKTDKAVKSNFSERVHLDF